MLTPPSGGTLSLLIGTTAVGMSCAAFVAHVRTFKSPAEAMPNSAMAKRKKSYGPSIEIQSPADALVQGGQLFARGIGKLGAALKQRAARRDLPENLRALVGAIDAFQPARTYRREVNYQTELTGWLKAKIGATVNIEEQHGRSRPDIVVAGTIAIEIKGPTTNQELKTIPDKVIRYRQTWPSMLCVLFDVQDQVRYQEWLRGMEERFPEVVVISKP
jgi:hypothetical protein